MWLSENVGACLTLTLCLTTTTTGIAFLPPSAALKKAVLTRGYHRTCARCIEAMPLKMSTMKTKGCSTTKQPRNGRGFELLPTMLSQRPRARLAQLILDETGTGVNRAEKQRRWRGIVRRNMMMLMTAFIVRSTFWPQPADAVSVLRGRSSREQRLEQERREKKLAAARERQLDQQREHNTEDAEATASTALADAEGTMNEDAVPGEMALDGGGVEGTTRLAADDLNELAGRSPGIQEGQVVKNKGYKKAARPKRDPSEKTRMGAFSSAAIGGFAIYNIISSVKGSSDIMSKQRRRVRVESAKFDQQKDEFMNVEGEAAVDVDMMKELRDMKEKMAGPGDKYAKETRKYNPEFAADHPDEDYDAKVKEALRSKGQGGTTPKKGKTGIVFTGDDYDASTTANPKPASGEDDNLLGDDHDDGDVAEGESLSKAESQSAAKAAQAKKDEDVKRLQELFNNSPSDDSDSPEDDLGNERELLP